MKIKNKGFTLIELLVVIAIIGILSAIVLASLTSARAKGADAAVKANLDGIRAQAGIVYDDNSQTYTNVCTDPNVSSAVQEALTVGGDAGAVNERCFSDSTTWVAWSALKTAGSGYWCTDSTGASKNEPAGTTMPAAAGTPCP